MWRKTKITSWDEKDLQVICVWNMEYNKDTYLNGLISQTT